MIYNGVIIYRDFFFIFFLTCVCVCVPILLYHSRSHLKHVWGCVYVCLVCMFVNTFFPVLYAFRFIFRKVKTFFILTRDAPPHSVYGCTLEGHTVTEYIVYFNSPKSIDTHTRTHTDILTAKYIPILYRYIFTSDWSEWKIM